MAFSENERIKAQRFGKDYWVGILTKAAPKPHMIHGPASKLRPKEEVKIVRYVVERKDWANVSERRR